MVRLLPEPDSPTTPSESPSPTAMLTRSTARLTAVGEGNATVRFSISSRAMSATGVKLVAILISHGRACPGHPDNRAPSLPHPTLPRCAGEGRVGDRDKPGDDAISFVPVTHVSASVWGRAHRAGRRREG